MRSLKETTGSKWQFFCEVSHVKQTWKTLEALPFLQNRKGNEKRVFIPSANLEAILLSREQTFHLCTGLFCFSCRSGMWSQQQWQPAACSGTSGNVGVALQAQGNYRLLKTREIRARARALHQHVQHPGTLSSAPKLWHPKGYFSLSFQFSPTFLGNKREKIIVLKRNSATYNITHQGMSSWDNLFVQDLRGSGVVHNSTEIRKFQQTLLLQPLPVKLFLLFEMPSPSQQSHVIWAVNKRRAAKNIREGFCSQGTPANLLPAVSRTYWNPASGVKAKRAGEKHIRTITPIEMLLWY